MRAACVIGLGLIACTPSPAPRPQPLAEPTPTEAARVDASAPLASYDAGGADNDVPDSIPAPRADVDPKSIRGYVRGMRGSDAASLDGKLTAVETKPRDEYLADLRFVITDAQGGAHRFHLIVPRALPVPFAVGERVRSRGDWTGGGPNQRLSLLVTAADGSTLLAIDTPPEGWKIERGKRTATDDGSTAYVEHDHGVVFEHGGAKLEVTPGAWARFGDFYVWGSAAVRKPKSARLPPDYVGSWLDSAIVRAR